MLDHENRVRDEFTRQAETSSASSAITDAALTQRFVGALGEMGRGSVLDVACGPGILSAAIAKSARDVVAFDLTPRQLQCRGDPPLGASLLRSATRDVRNLPCAAAGDCFTAGI